MFSVKSDYLICACSTLFLSFDGIAIYIVDFFKSCQIHCVFFQICEGKHSGKEIEEKIKPPKDYLFFQAKYQDCWASELICVGQLRSQQFQDFFEQDHEQSG